MNRLKVTVPFFLAMVFSTAVHSDDWVGPYAGVHLGKGSNSVDGVFDSAGSAIGLDTLEDSDSVYGLHLGYNNRRNKVVYGIEASYTKSNMEDGVWDSESNLQEFETKDYWTLRGRLGWLVSEQALIYATAGIASMDSEIRVEQNQNNSTPDKLGIRDKALVLGAGFEYMFKNNLSIKAEALRMDFDKNKNLNIPGVLSDADSGDTIEVGDVWAVSIGLSYNF
jgi:opacity protein-like surface antigen